MGLLKFLPYTKYNISSKISCQTDQKKKKIPLNPLLLTMRYFLYTILYPSEFQMTI